MSDQVPQPAADADLEADDQHGAADGSAADLPDLSGEAESATASGGPDRPSEQSTGHPAVDEVLRSLDRLEDQPVSEHVGVFEQAHESLRRALSDAGDAQD